MTLPPDQVFERHWKHLTGRQRRIVWDIVRKAQRADDAGTAWLVTNAVRRERSRAGVYLALAAGFAFLGLLVGIAWGRWVMFASGVGYGLGQLVFWRRRHEAAERANADLAEQFDPSSVHLER